MNPHARDALDARIADAWPIDVARSEAPPDAVHRLRVLVDERIAGGVEPETDRTRAPSTKARGLRRPVAVALAGVVLLAGTLAVGSLVAGRLRQQPVHDRTEQSATEDGDAVEDPTSSVRVASAATHRALAELTVTGVLRQWVNREGDSYTDVDDLIEHTEPVHVVRTVDAANGDWSYVDAWELRGTGMRVRGQGECPAAAGECVEGLGAMRYVGGQWYERPQGDRIWAHVVDRGRRPAELTRDAVPLLERSTALALLERYDGSWASQREDATGLSTYVSTDADAAARLTHGLILADVFDDDPGSMESTVQVWVDDAGLVRRIRSELPTMNRDGATLLRHDVAFDYGAASPVEAPERVTEISFDEWCARSTNVCE